MRISLRELLIVVAVVAVGITSLKLGTLALQTVVQLMVGVLLLRFLVVALIDREGAQAFAIGFVACGFSYAAVSYLDRIDQPAFTGAFGTTRLLDLAHPLFQSHQWVDRTGQAIGDIALLDQSSARSVFRIESNDADGRSKVIATIPRGHADFDKLNGWPNYKRMIESAERGPDRTVASLVPADVSAEEASNLSALEHERMAQALAILATTVGRRVVNGGATPSTLRLEYYRYTSTPALDDFRTVGYCMFTLLVGYVGGSFARYVYSRRAAAANR
jgi:hypothetical protein